MQNTEDTSAVILASGLSERMKMSKAELKFDRIRNFFQKITEEYLNFGCKEVIVVMNSENFNSLKQKINIPDEIKLIINKYPEKGRFYSLKTGILNLKQNSFTFIQNIDNPFVNQTILKLLKDNSDIADYIIPSYQNKGGHPILISEKIVKAVTNTGEETQNMKEFFNRFNKHYAICSDKKILANINTISDYHLYF